MSMYASGTLADLSGEERDMFGVRRTHEQSCKQRGIIEVPCRSGADEVGKHALVRPDTVTPDLVAHHGARRRGNDASKQVVKVFPCAFGVRLTKGSVERAAHMHLAHRPFGPKTQVEHKRGFPRVHAI